MSDVAMCSVCRTNPADIAVTAAWVGVSPKGEQLLEKARATGSVDQLFCVSCAGRVGFAMNDLQDEIRDEADEGSVADDG